MSSKLLRRFVRLGSKINGDKQVKRRYCICRKGVVLYEYRAYGPNPEGWRPVLIGLLPCIRCQGAHLQYKVHQDIYLALKAQYPPTTCMLDWGPYHG